MRQTRKVGSLILALILFLSGVPMGIMPAFAVDTTPPADPTVISSRTHTVGAWSNETTIGMEWIGGADTSSGVEGYSYSFAKDATALPDTAVDTAPVDFNRSTIAGGYYHTVGVTADGTVTAVGDNSGGQTTGTAAWTDIVAVSAGTTHTVGLKSDGTVVAAGDNSYGQTSVSGWSDIVAVAAGAYHTIGLKADGTVAAVGNGGDGRTNVSGWSNIFAVAAGGAHTVGLTADGTVAAVGNNIYGQLNVASWTDIKSIAAGYLHTVGLKSNGAVVAVGNNTYGQTTGTASWTDIRAVAAGTYHTVGLKSDGTVVAVGNNTFGQINVSGWSGIVAVAAGGLHTIGLKSDGTVVTTGSNGYGQTNTSPWSGVRQPTYTAEYGVSAVGDWWFNLRTKDRAGNWTSTVHRGPFRIEGAAPVDPAVTGSTPATDTWTNDNTILVNFSGAIDSSSGVDGFSIEWSDSSATVPDAVKDIEESAVSTTSPSQPDGNRYFHLRTVDNAGNWTSTIHYGPFKIETAAPADPIIISSPSHTPGVWSNETTVGINWIGGIDTSSGVAGYSYSWSKDTTALPDTAIDTVPIDFSLPTIAAGSGHSAEDGHTVGLKSDGTVAAVGLDDSSQVSGTAAWTDVKAIAAGAGYTIGLKSNGTVAAVGNNDYGQTTGTAAWTDIVAVAAGYGHTVGLKANGTAVAVGLNEGPGQIDVGSWTDITAIAAGYFHTVGLKADGTVVANGFGAFGQTDLSSWTDIIAVAAGFRHTVGLKADGTVLTKGDNTFGSIDVSGWSDIVAVAAGQFHTVGLKSDGTVVAVGNNSQGQTDVSTWTDIVAVAAGANHTVGLKSDGTAVATGNNDYGQTTGTAAWTGIKLRTVDSQVPTGGAWYFNLRTKDRAGNWTSTVHRGPFLIDASAPTNPVVTGSTPSKGVWTNDNTILVNFAGATDTLSGVDGYSVAWSGSSFTQPDAVKDLEESAGSALSPAQPDGMRWFHLRIRDNAGNWTSTRHYGPFKIDTVKPTARVRAPSTTTGSGLTTRFRVRWSGSDARSGIKNYDVAYKIGKRGRWKRWKTGVTALRGRFTGKTGKTYYFRARARDKGGNLGAWSRRRRTAVNGL